MARHGRRRIVVPSADRAHGEDPLWRGSSFREGEGRRVPIASQQQDCHVAMADMVKLSGQIVIDWLEYYSWIDPTAAVVPIMSSLLLCSH